MWLTGHHAMPEVTHTFNSLTCDLWDTMPYQGSPTLIPREAKDYPRGNNHYKHVPLPTYLAWLEPIYYNSRYVFIHVKTNFACGEDINLIKKHRAEAKLISSNENIEQQPHPSAAAMNQKINITAPSKNAFQNMARF